MSTGNPPRPEPDAAALRAVSSRLARHSDEATHVVAVVRVFDAAETDTPDRRTRTPEHWLAAAWALPMPARWPDAAALGSPSGERALLELLTRLGGEARATLVDAHELDMALAADIVLCVDRNLEPYQREGLRAFAGRWREAEAASIASRYTDRDPGFESHMARLRQRD